MRHGNGLRKLNRTSSHRLAMLRNMSNSLLEHEVIKTTLPKAKELRMVVEPLITLGKKDSLANRRLAYNRTRDRDIVAKLFTELGPRYATRPGGYLRILKFGFRQGDNAPMALVELVDRPIVEEVAVEDKQIVVYNDDFNTFDHVINSLIKVCKHDPIQAEQCTFLIHHKGKCSVKKGSYEKLEPMCTALLERGITAEIE